jgi:hypothetical protein
LGPPTRVAARTIRSLVSHSGQRVCFGLTDLKDLLHFAQRILTLPLILYHSSLSLVSLPHYPNML